tara:strand:+ start:250 stop:678 length:429 start_codon:yes stop_codon:yes gene_type:complete
MKIPTIIILLLISPSVWSIACNELVRRDGVTFKKGSDERFSGKVTSFCRRIYSGTYINGRCEGRCKTYFDNENLFKDYFIKNGKMEGVQRIYWANGNLRAMWREEKALEDGLTESWLEDGSLSQRLIFKNGKCVEEIVGRCF